MQLFHTPTKNKTSTTPTSSIIEMEVWHKYTTPNGCEGDITNKHDDSQRIQNQLEMMVQH